MNIADQSKPLHIPALIIATLVENAVQHGIAPKPEGGVIAITSHYSLEKLTLTVSDDGLGFIKTSGKGLGIATIKARLKGTYAGKAKLTITNQSPAGIIASIEIPTHLLRSSSPQPASA